MDKQYTESTEQSSAQFAAKGAKLQKLKQGAKPKAKKKCKCGCEIVTKKQGGKLVESCACGCATKHAEGGTLPSGQFIAKLPFKGNKNIPKAPEKPKGSIKPSVDWLEKSKDTQNKTTVPNRIKPKVEAKTVTPAAKTTPAAKPAPTKTVPQRVKPKSSSETKSHQTTLTSLGFNTKGADGISGKNTDSAVRAFQKSAGIKVDGIIGPQTRLAMKKASAKKSTESVSTPKIAKLETKSPASSTPSKISSSKKGGPVTKRITATDETAIPNKDQGGVDMNPRDWKKGESNASPKFVNKTKTKDRISTAKPTAKPKLLKPKK